MPRAPLRGDSLNLFEVDNPHWFTRVRLRIHPDGGVARLRVHGVVVPDPTLFPDGQLDLAALEHGGLVVGCSDMFYGAPRQLIAPGLARTMGEGWETARRRDDGRDWVRVRLAVPGQIRQVELDTSHFRGNAPAAAMRRGIDTRVADPAESAGWFEILPRTRLQDTRHRFAVDPVPTATDVRLGVFPNGGMARLRLPGRIAAVDLTALRRRWSVSLPPAHARQVSPSGARPTGAWWP